MRRYLRAPTIPPREIPNVVVSAAVLLEAVYLGTMVAVGGLQVLLTPFALFGIALTVPFTLGPIYGGYRLARNDISVERYPRIGKWCLAVTGLYLGLNLAIIAMFSPWPGLANTGWVLFSAMIGLTGGLALGIIEARAIERAVAAEREATRAEQIEEQRDWFEYLNGLLRHEVLNSAHLINGYVDVLREDLEADDERLEYLSRIGRRSRKMTEVIQDVRVLLRAADERDEFEPVDVVSLLSSEVSALLDEYDGIYVETSWPEEANVPADDLLARVFSNLLTNAVEHNDSEEPSIGVTVETDDDVVTVTITDNGPGIPAETREALFEREGRGDPGLGLYHVDRLDVRFGGSIGLTETGPGGSTFVVELPRAAPEEPTVEAELEAAVADAS